MPYTVDLGNFQVTKAKFDLVVTVRGETLFSLHNLDAIAPHVEQARLLPQLLQSSWVREAKDLLLEIQLRMESGSKFGVNELQLAEEFTKGLQHAEIWQLLKIEPHYLDEMDANLPDDPFHRIRLILTRSHSNSIEQKRKRHRLAEDVPILDTQPPSGMSIYNLEQIVLFLAVSSENEQSNPERRSPMIPERIEEILQLLGFAVCAALCSKQCLLPKCIRTCGQRNFIPLDQLAPVVFDPSFLPAVYERACFIPTISHALAGHIRTLEDEAAKSGSSDSKRLCQTGFESRHTLAKSHSSQNSSPEINEVESMLKVQIWKILQENMKERKSLQKLKTCLPHDLRIPGTLAVDFDQLCEGASPEMCDGRLTLPGERSSDRSEYQIIDWDSMADYSALEHYNEDIEGSLDSLLNSPCSDSSLLSTRLEYEATLSSSEGWNISKVVSPDKRAESSSPLSHCHKPQVHLDQLSGCATQVDEADFDHFWNELEFSMERSSLDMMDDMQASIFLPNQNPGTSDEDITSL